MDRIPQFLVAIFLIAIASGCKKEKVAGTGAIVTEERNVNNFYNVRVDGNTPVSITAGTEFKVSVKGYESILPHLQTIVKDGTLRIQFDKNITIANDNSEVHITMPKLAGVISHGNGDVKILGQFIGADIITIEKSGNGDVTAGAGTVRDLKVTLNGKSNYRGFDFVCQNAVIIINGTGDAELSVLKSLNATINGNGNVYYKGNPEVTSKISGTGKVIRK